MQRLSSLAFSCALVLLGSACTDCSGTGDGDAGPAPSLSDAEIKELCVIYTAGYNNSFTFELQRAGVLVCSAEDRFVEFDAETLQAFEEGCEPGAIYYDIFATASEGGRVDIDMEKTRACVEKGRAQRASTTVDQYIRGEGGLFALLEDADCQGAITPLVDEGGECVQQWDCAEGLWCEPEVPDSATLRCQQPAQDGERCGGARYCDVDLYCTDNDVDDEVCAPAIAEGADCVTDPLGARGCVVGTFCDDADTGLCQPLLAQGATCMDSAQCEASLSCTGDPFADPPTPGTCEPTPAPVADGQACDPELDVCSALCSVCRPEASGGPTLCLDPGGAGAYCESDLHCRGGFACSGGACTALPDVELPALGESCDAGEGCAEGFCVSGQCVAGEEGDPCDADALECAGDFICVVVATAGTCQPLPRAGEACIEGSCVASAYCSADDQCETLREPGASCEDDVECASGTCLNGGTCAAAGPSCDESREYFIQFVTLGLILPLVVRVRRRRR